MNKFSVTISALLILASAPAWADSTNTSGSQAGANSSVNVVNPKQYRNVGNAYAPGLAASGMACLGSNSAAFGGSGFSLAFGGTKEDRQCNARENAKVVGTIGDLPASKEIMCGIPEVRAAFLQVGHPCMIDRVARTNGKSNKAGKVYRTASGREIKKTAYP